MLETNKKQKDSAKKQKFSEKIEDNKKIKMKTIEQTYTITKIKISLDMFQYARRHVHTRVHTHIKGIERETTPYLHEGKTIKITVNFS